MENETKDEKYHLNMLEKCREFGKKKIIYHENAHLLFGRFLGMTCEYVDYTINSSIEKKEGSIEMVFESKAHAYIAIAPELEQYFASLYLGGTTEEFIAKTGIPEETLQLGTMSYLTMLYAGYEAERYFFSDKNFDDIKTYIETYSEDQTIRNILEDETKANRILTDIGFTSDAKIQYKAGCIDIINTVICEDKMVSLFHELYKRSQEKHKLEKSEIEEILKNNEFDTWTKELKQKLGSD